MNIPPHGSLPPTLIRPARLGDWCVYVSHHRADSALPPVVLRVTREEGAGKCYTSTHEGATFYDVGMSGCACATLLRRIPDAYADDEKAREAYAFGLSDGYWDRPYARDPRQHAGGSSIFALARLAYRQGFRAGHALGHPVLVAHLCQKRARAAAEVLRIGSVPRTIDTWPEGERRVRPEMREKVRAILRTARDKASAAAQRPTVATFVSVLARFAAGAAVYRVACPDVCGADDAHLEALDRWRHTAADAAEALAWLQDPTYGGGAALFPGQLASRRRRRTPEAYVDDLETGHASAPDGTRAPAPFCAG